MQLPRDHEPPSRLRLLSGFKHVKATLPAIALCHADEATFWPWFRWPDFANWPDKDRTVVIMPIAGFADWGLGYGMDLEETVLMSVVNAASVQRRPGLPLLVLPPVRFVLGPQPGCAFPVDPDVACDLLEEIASSVAAAGFSRILLFNASPWNEELCKAVGRDLRINRKLQMFCVHLSSLGMDFNPARGGDRAKLKSVVAALLGDPAAATAAQGREWLAQAAARFAGLLGEMRDRPPLAHGGDLPTLTWP